MRAAVAVVIGALMVIATAGASVGGKNTAAPPPQAPACAPVLSSPDHGRSAVDKLGSKLADVAKHNKRGEQKLRRQLLTDATLWVDECGALFHVESDELPNDPPQMALTMVFPSAQTFLLHSRPGAARVIYLDFNGELVSGTAWNNMFYGGADIAAPPFDIDGAPATFSTDERAIVQNVWLRVAEDYAAFDVDVTTEDPGLAAIDRTSSSDLNFGTRALITNESQLFNACGCAGIAYVGVFGSSGSHQYYQPAFVLQRGTGSNAKIIGEVVSHEVGHNLGLSHDGTSTTSYYSGQGSWAPIMGTAYNRPISQWSSGDYAGANNTEDDFALMVANGAPLPSDDVPDTRASARAIASGATFAGRIGSAADVDYFVFSGSGQVTIAASVGSVSPNLDLSIDLYNSADSLIAHADPAAATVSADMATGLSATLTSALPASGTYYFKIDGVGLGDPAAGGYSDYASVGAYSVALTVSDPSSAPSIGTTALPDASYGQAYSATLSASGGVPPYTWGLAAGSTPLPADLTLASNTGAIAGTPTAAAGTYSLTFKVVDSRGVSSTKALTLKIVDQPLVITSAIPLAAASLTQPYSLQLNASGGRGGYVWSIASGTLPSGISLSAGGLLSGTPTKASTYSFTVRVTSGTVAVTKSLSISVTAPVVVRTTTLADGFAGVSYSASLTAAGGTGKYVWEVASGEMPPGLSLSVSSINGVPTVRGTYALDVRVTDTAGRSAIGTVKVTIYQLVMLTDSLPGATKGVDYSVQMVADGGKPIYKWSRASGSFPSGITMTSTGLVYGKATVTGTFTVGIKVQDAARKTVTRTFTFIVAAS